MNIETLERIKGVLALFSVENFRALQRAYGGEDQRLMKSRLWDDQDPSLLTNRTKALLQEIDPTQLDEEDRVWWREIMWFWYHHAISCAIWKRKDRELARFYASKALEFQDSDHPNRITRLLWFLVHDQVQEAKEWAGQIADEQERVTASQLVDEYEKGEFF